MGHVRTDADDRYEAYRDYAEDSDYQRAEGHSDAPTMTYQQWVDHFSYRRGRRLPDYD